MSCAPISQDQGLFLTGITVADEERPLPEDDEKSKQQLPKGWGGAGVVATLVLAAPFVGGRLSPNNCTN